MYYDTNSEYVYILEWQTKFHQQTKKRSFSICSVFQMDLQILYLTSLCTLIIFMFMAMTKKSSPTPKLPPGPMKLPIIGNIHNLVGGSYPHRRLRDLSKKYGPLMHLKLGEVSFMVVSSPECAKEVLKTHDLKFASRPPILATKILTYDSLGVSFAPYGDYWRQLRKIFALELLSTKRVQSFQPIREEEFNNLIKLIASKEGSPINLTKEVFTTISRITVRTAFGNKCKENQQFISIIKDAVQIASGFDLGDMYPSAKWLQHVSGLKPKLEKLHHEADRIMQNIIDEHKEAKARAGQGLQGEEVEEDMVDVLLKFQHNQQEFHLTNESIKAVIMDTFGGGTETSSTVINWTMAEMIKNPRVLKKVQAEVREVFKKEGKPSESDSEKLKYLKAVVKEALRLHPPGVLLLPRECGQACEINGYHIPLKSKIIINAWAIGRDPNHWADPETFYPERFMDSSVDYKGNDFKFIPFGAGRRICPGIVFGMVNVEVPLALLLYHFDWKLPNGMKNQDLDLTEVFGAAVMKKEDLNLIPTIYHP